MISAAPKVTPIRPIAAVGIGSRISAAITVTNSAKNCQAWAKSPAGTGLATMTAVGLAMTGSAALGGTMAVANTAVGLTCYVIYERVWARIGWGRGDRHG